MSMIGPGIVLGHGREQGGARGHRQAPSDEIRRQEAPCGRRLRRAAPGSWCSRLLCRSDITCTGPCNRTSRCGVNGGLAAAARARSTAVGSAPTCWLSRPPPRCRPAAAPPPPARAAACTRRTCLASLRCSGRTNKPRTAPTIVAATVASGAVGLPRRSRMRQHLRPKNLTFLVKF